MNEAFFSGDKGQEKYFGQQWFGLQSNHHLRGPVHMTNLTCTMDKLLDPK